MPEVSGRFFGGSYYLNEWINGGLNDEFDIR